MGESEAVEREGRREGGREGRMRETKQEFVCWWKTVVVVKKKRGIRYEEREVKKRKEKGEEKDKKV